MGKISPVRVVIGGLVAGLVITGANAAADRQLTALMGVDKFTMPGMFTGWSHLAELALGILVSWLYASIRPRFGAGPRTAIIAGLAGWLFSYGFIWFEWVDRWPAGARWSIDIVTVWRLAGCVVGAWLAGWLYREKMDGGARRR